MTALAPGDRVTVVEHDDADRRPRSGGRTYRACVIQVTRLYVMIAYDSPSLTRTGTDLFYSESGWRAFDWEYRWRLRGPAGWLR
jgi:hypothetical protein